MISELTRQRIEDSRVKIARVINTLETVHQTLDWTFETNPEWNSELKYQVEEAITKLGMSLATLTTWWDDEDEGDK